VLNEPKSNYTIQDSDELHMLAGLMRDFPAIERDVKTALERVEVRYKEVREQILFKSERINLSPQTIHQYLYQDILSNAGEYRKITDPGNGTVYFGGQDAQTAYGHRYQGCVPTDIHQSVLNCLEVLQAKNELPVINSAIFYQQFVYIHPFYDANGRIGRLLIDAYLIEYQKIVDWKKLQANHDWLKKLNNCHDRMRADNNSLREYLGYWKNYFAKFVSESELNEDERFGLPA
jgi:Fic family protein